MDEKENTNVKPEPEEKGKYLVAEVLKHAQIDLIPESKCVLENSISESLSDASSTVRLDAENINEVEIKIAELLAWNIYRDMLLSN